MGLSIDRYEVDSNEQIDGRQKRDLRLYLLRLYAVFAVLTLTAVLLFASYTRNQLEKEVLASDLALTQFMAAQVNLPIQDNEQMKEEIAGWLDAASMGEETVVVIIDSDGQTILRYDYGRQPWANPAWLSWQRAVNHTTRDEEAGSFVTTDPEGQEWVHAFSLISGSDARMLMERPSQTAYASWQRITQGLFIVVALFLVGSMIFGGILFGRVIRPLERLELFSGLVRWRGYLRPQEKKQLDQLSQRPDQIGSLAHSLSDMAEDIEMRFVQLSTLLETARAVASSLDFSAVLDNILDQVQQLFHVERCAVVVLDKRADVFRIRASRGLSQRYVDQLRIAPSEPHSPSMRALRNQTPIQVSDTETDLSFNAFRPNAQEEGYRSVLAIPLFTLHAPEAVLLLYKAEPYRYSFRELELASSFGDHVSIAMENAALFARSDERLQEQTRRLEAIVESLNDGLILESLSGEVLYCNQQALKWIDLPRREVRQANLADLVAILVETAVNPTDARHTIEAAISGNGPRTFHLAQKLGDGRFRHSRIHMFDVTDDRGELLGRGQLWQDVTKEMEIDRMKSSLLSTVSHELRTPLATIKGYASTLLAPDVEWDASAQREFLETISQETDRLTALVKNLLDMSRIEAGMLDMQCELYSLNDLLMQIVQGFRPKIGRDLLQIHLEEELPPVRIDPPRMGTVIRNLLENAAKYSPPNKEIEITTQRQNGFVTLSVRDYGRGVPPELQDKIFDRFFRVDNRLTRQIGGAGLGLAICKGFVEAHNGHVWVNSAQPGAVFGFSLPLDPADE